tara:strand:- start:18 stop:152 length:135 start_codon:yes stop_codon:yes gene_type:complete
MESTTTKMKDIEKELSKSGKEVIHLEGVLNITVTEADLHNARIL